MTDKKPDRRLDPDDIGYQRQEALARLRAAGEPGGEPYQARPAIEIHLGHPTSTSGGRSPSVLRIEDEVSGQLLFELELDPYALHDLLSGRTARPVVRWYNPHPGRIGHPETMWTIVCEDQDAADLMRERLRSHGWTVSDTLTRSRGWTVGYVWPVTGRRWDGEPAGTVCPTCRYPLPNSMAAWCAECDSP